MILYKLFHLMIELNTANTQSKELARVSANIITRLKRDEHVSAGKCWKICRALNSSVKDILNFIPLEKESN